LTFCPYDLAEPLFPPEVCSPLYRERLAAAIRGGASRCDPRTESLEGVGHGLVLGHVDEPSAQAEVREDEEHLLQDAVHLVQML